MKIFNGIRKWRSTVNENSSNGIIKGSFIVWDFVKNAKSARPITARYNFRDVRDF